MLLIVPTFSFMITIYDNPAALPLPTNEKGYFLHYVTSGFGLSQIAADLNSRAVRAGHPLNIVGVIANCYAINLYLPANSLVHLDCTGMADIVSDGTSFDQGIQNSADVLNNLIAEQGQAFVLVQNNEHIERVGWHLPQPNSLVATYQTGDMNYPISLYQVSRP